MPSIRIETRCASTVEHEAALVAAVRSAVAEAFAVPSDECDVRLVAHAPHRFAVPSRLTEPQVYTLVEVTAMIGRSLGAKRRLYAAAVERLADLGIPGDHVKVLLHELPAENVSPRNGAAACDMELGYEVDI